VLIAARLVQGLAAGIQMPQVLGTIQQIFVGKERGRAFGLFGATIGVATAIGPTFGGLMIAVGGVQDGWRWIFWINVPLCALVIAGVLGLLPRTRRDARSSAAGPRRPRAARVHDRDPHVALPLHDGRPDRRPAGGGAVLFVVFVTAFTWWERRYAASGRSPLVPFSLFSISSFRNGTLVVTTYFTAIPAMFLLTTLFLQIGIGTEPVFAGMVSIGFAVASAITAWFGGSLVARPRAPARGGG
jgi:MFS family permease